MTSFDRALHDVKVLREIRPPSFMYVLHFYIWSRCAYSRFAIGDSMRDPIVHNSISYSHYQRGYKLFRSA